MGFTLYDEDNYIIHNRPVTHTGFNENHDIVVPTEIAEIVFHGTSNGFHGSFVVYDSAGSTRLFQCSNCLSNSPTTELKNVYIDTDMNGDVNLPDTANCQNLCRFSAGKLTQLTYV